ncbi:MAG: hypothetical protein WA584_23680 [Pyrinomonadaceae bacterium]
MANQKFFIVKARIKGARLAMYYTGRCSVKGKSLYCSNRKKALLFLKEEEAILTRLSVNAAQTEVEAF